MEDVQTVVSETNELVHQKKSYTMAIFGTFSYAVSVVSNETQYFRFENDLQVNSCQLTLYWPNTTVGFGNNHECWKEKNLHFFGYVGYRVSIARKEMQYFMFEKLLPKTKLFRETLMEEKQTVVLKKFECHYRENESWAKFDFGR